ncbi:unnamed protein product [Allacma fusca]|uniref:Uncharacterized protein n=1 Tax=Allacma fusca TaxID=39272 RepID=A0A8J2JS60_9HEXA|nr:unnamed protein product [Allacma fusca]
MFLNGIKTDLPEVISDDMERQTAEELIDTILTQDSNGTYTKISFFRQPDEEGPIHQIPSVMSQRPHILNMVFNNTNYTRSVPEDFGISLSPKAILLLTKVVAKINQDLAGDFKVITLQWSANYRNSIEMAPLNTLGEQLTKQNKIEVTISTLSSSNSREDFLQSFDIISMQAASNGSMHDTIVRMGNRLKHLEFFEKSLGQNFSAPISEWAFPFTEFLQELKNATAKQAAALNDQIDQQCLQLGSALTDYFKGYVLNTEVQIQKMELTLSILIHGHQKLMEMVSALEKSTTINGFVGTLKQNIHELIPTLETSNLILLTEDVKMDDEKASLPFSLVSWLSPFYKLTKYVSEQVSMMKIGIQNEKHRIEREEAERRRRMEEEERERQRIAREEQEKREREEAERRRVEHEERMRIEREAQAREALRRQQEYMDLLWRQRRRSSRGGFGQGFNIGFTFRF